VIGGSVIDKNEFVIDGPERGPELSLQDRDIFFLVEEGHNYRNLG